jgi:hypothetical protein
LEENAMKMPLPDTLPRPSLTVDVMKIKGGWVVRGEGCYKVDGCKWTSFAAVKTPEEIAPAIVEMMDGLQEVE